MLCPAVLAPGLQHLEGISTRMTFPSEKSPISWRDFITVVPISSGSSAAEKKEKGRQACSVQKRAQSDPSVSSKKIQELPINQWPTEPGFYGSAFTEPKVWKKVLFTKPNQNQPKISSGSSAAETRTRLAQCRSKHSLILLYLDWLNQGFMVLPELSQKWRKNFCSLNTTKKTQKYLMAAQHCITLVGCAQNTWIHNQIVCMP